MHDSNLENRLIVVGIVDAMTDYCSIQIDIDETKVKAAELVAQNIDVKRIIGKDNVARCVEPVTETDNELRDLVIPALCYYTYARCLKMFQGTFTDSGYTSEVEAETRSISKSVGTEMHGIAEVYMQDVLDFLQEEDANDSDVNGTKLTPSIRVFGGEENRASN